MGATRQLGNWHLQGTVNMNLNPTAAQAACSTHAPGSSRFRIPTPIRKVNEKRCRSLPQDFGYYLGTWVSDY